MHVEPGMGPGQHRPCLKLLEELEADEEPEHGAPKGFGEDLHIVGGPGEEGAVGPKPAIRHDPLRPLVPREEAVDGEAMLVQWYPIPRIALFAFGVPFSGREPNKSTV